MRRALTVLALLPAIAQAQLSPTLADWIRRVHSGEFSTPRTRPGRWIENGAAYLAGNSRIDTATGARRELPAESYRPPNLDRALANPTPSPDGRKLLFAANPRTVRIRKTASDYWVLDRPSNTWRKIGDGLLFAKFSPDSTRIAYLAPPHYNLTVQDLSTGAVTPLTTDASADLIDGTSDWVNDEEFFISDGFQWSPNGRWIAYYQFDQSRVPEFPLVNYTDTLDPVVTLYKYPKPGQTNSAVRVGIVRPSGGATRWLKTPGDPRDTYIPYIQWTADGRLVLQHMNRLQNTNTVFLADPATGDLHRMFQDTDPAWVEVNRNLRWIENGRRLLFTSERDGWRHIYAVSREGDARLITREPFDIVSVAAIDEPGGWVYFIASPENPVQRYLYRARLDGSRTERVTPAGQPGTHTYNISPDVHWAFHTVSSFDSPGQTDLISLPDHKLVRVLDDNAALKAKIAPLLAGRTEFFRVSVGHETSVDGWLIRPSKFDPARKYPIIVNVYGEPAASTVNDAWGGPNRVLMAALADEGYLVASFDNSGTPTPKGRHWRKVIYGAVGVLASDEQAAALRALASTHPYVDVTRVGVFGWSGGGSMTLNLMFRHPELYHVGVAGAPVADQALYDTIYQERYMGLPAGNPKGYRDGSPITFAEGLQGKLLIVHGTGDDNVHFQGTQKLLNRLIALGKQIHFMEYPNRRHGVASSDPVHLDTLRYSFFEEYLPAGPKQAAPQQPSRADLLRGAYGPYRANNDLVYYHLDVRIDPAQKTIAGKNTIRFRMLQDGARIQLDLSDALAIDKILWNARPLRYTRDSGAVFVDFPETLRAGETYSVDFYYSGHPVETGRFGAITFKQDPAGRPWINTACEESGASTWWPNKDQWRDEVESMDISVAVPNGLTDVRIPAKVNADSEGNANGIPGRRRTGFGA